MLEWVERGAKFRERVGVLKGVAAGNEHWWQCQNSKRGGGMSVVVGPKWAQWE